jgi:aminopeptidase N
MGFRRITFWPDRPDVLSQWSVRLEGDAAALPVLLSNGNLTQAGQLPGGRHYTMWEVGLMRDHCTAATMYCWT